MAEYALTSVILRAVRLAVADGLEPDKALAAVMGVVGIMVSEVRDPVRRGQWEEHVLRTFPLAVSGRQHGSAVQ